MTASRDYVGEMAVLIEKATAGSDWVPAVVAASIRDQLAEKDPELLNGWLHVLAVQLLTDEIRMRERSIRSVVRSRAGAREFAAAAESGEAVRLRAFAVTFAVDDANTRRRVADMRGPDHRYVAEHYQSSANRAQMLAAFHLAVARKVGRRRTADVLSEVQYERMFRSITGAAPEVAAS